MQFPVSSAGELYQRRLPETVSRRQADQTAQAGLHDTNFTLDLCTILQSKWTSNLFIRSNRFNSKLIAGSALRLSSHSDVVFHLRDHRYAGTYVPVDVCYTLVDSFLISSLISRTRPSSRTESFQCATIRKVDIGDGSVGNRASHAIYRNRMLNDTRS